MNMIDIKIAAKSDLPSLLNDIFKKFYDTYEDITSSVTTFIKPMDDDCKFVVEYPYVDKVFRDSFYRYYSSKFALYKRDCIKVSVFKGAVTDASFLKDLARKRLKNNYYGFFIVRPTFPLIIGRSILSPKIYNHTPFYTCTSKYDTTVNGIKFTVDAFPSSSQDLETIQCAETTLWAMMEYFSNKYPDYSPLLPSRIIEILEQITPQRQIPARGLQINEMSYGLKALGFGSEIYYRGGYAGKFDNLLSCYVESGIPLILGMLNSKIAHAFICTGRSEIKKASINSLTKRDQYYDFDDIEKEFVFVDDNLTPYSLAPIKNPSINYTDPRFKNCNIDFFIAPLYSKIYLDAFKAKSYAKLLLQTFDIKGVYLRFYLASSRSYKNKIAGNNDLPNDIKEILLKKSMPKFIWVAEVTNKTNLMKEMVNGIMLLDATEANTNDYKPLILALKDKYLYLNGTKVEKFVLNNKLKPFKMYKANLTSST